MVGIIVICTSNSSCYVSIIRCTKQALMILQVIILAELSPRRRSKMTLNLVTSFSRGGISGTCACIWTWGDTKGLRLKLQTYMPILYSLKPCLVLPGDFPCLQLSSGNTRETLPRLWKSYPIGHAHLIHQSNKRGQSTKLLMLNM